MMRTKWQAMLLLLSPLVLTGCWDSVEVNNRAVILEFAVDKNTDYTYDPTVLEDAQKVYKVTYAIPDLGKLSGTESLATDAETTIVVEAPSIGASIDDLEIRNKDTVSFSHVKTILLGEALLKDKELFKRTIDAVSRDMLIARNVPVLAVNGEAGLTAQVENTEQPILGLYMMDYFKNRERPVCFFKKQLLGNFMREMDETSIGTLPVFHVEDIDNDEKGDEINISGAALIKDYELVDYLSKEEVRSQLFVEGKIRNVPIVARYRERPVTFIINNQTNKVHYNEKEGKLRAVMEVEIVGNITEYLVDEKNTQNLTDKEVVSELEKVIAEEVIKEIRLGIDKSKAINVDYMGFGLGIYRKHPDLWKKYAPTWEAGTYQEMPIEIGVRIDVESAGIQE